MNAPGRPNWDAATSRFARIAALDDALGLIGWDQRTMMPEGSAESRAELVATLEVMRHELLTGAALSDYVAAAAGEVAHDDDADGEWRRANVREMARSLAHARALPSDLVAARARAEGACEIRWRAARPAGDYAAVLPALAEVLGLAREAAAAKGAAFDLAPYDALLDQHEAGLRAPRVDALFARLEAFLPGFLGRVLDRQARRPAPLPIAGPFPVARQRVIAHELMAALGFDFRFGRLDETLHPFSGGAADDHRITTRYDENDFAPALMGVLHETGHALYDFGLPRAWRHQPVGTARGMVIHESQSLLVEMGVCRSRAFLGWAAPRIAAAFGGDGPQWSADNQWRLAALVKPDFIRVDADEVTYPAHILLRTRLERALLDRSLSLSDLPGAWADGMRSLLGIMPPDDRLGCLQDIHWYVGSFGYFPTYTLGALAAAQLLAAARTADPDIEPGIALGDFAPLFAWLRGNIHGYGSLLSAEELIARATGRPLDTAAFEAHLTARYLG